LIKQKQLKKRNISSEKKYQQKVGKTQAKNQ